MDDMAVISEHDKSNKQALSYIEGMQEDGVVALPVTADRLTGVPGDDRYLFKLVPAARLEGSLAYHEVQISLHIRQANYHQNLYALQRAGPRSLARRISCSRLIFCPTHV